MKRWLHVVQQRLSITNTEASALLAISFLLAVGLIVGEVRSRLPLFTDETYAVSDRLFREGAAASMRGLALAPTDTSGATAADSGTTAEAGLPVSSSNEAAADSKPEGAMMVDLNRATAADLQRLPRIGPALADRILAYRAEFGPFRRTSDIMNVRGIGEATYARLRPFLMIGGDAPEPSPPSGH